MEGVALEQPKKPAVNHGKRRIIAEDPEWNLAPVERLSNVCVQVLVKNFEKNPVLKKISQKYRDRIVSAISTDIPLAIAAPLIPDESYWERRAKKTFKLANVHEFGESWKRLYFELFIRDTIEAYKPIIDPANEKLVQLLEKVRLGAPFIEKLSLRQLFPVEPTNTFNPHGPLLENKNQLTELMNEVSPDRVDLSLILSQLTNLKDFSVYFGVKDCGIDFKWSYFGMTITDATKLSAALPTCQLTRLSITTSGVDDDRCRILANQLAKNQTIKTLDFCNNKIGDHGARALATLLVQPNTVLETLLLGNNMIGYEGVQFFGKALQRNQKLQELDLRLNRLGDEGGAVLLQLLEQNNGLASLNLSGNALGPKTVQSLAQLLKRNGEYLGKLDLSCNKLGQIPAQEDTDVVIPNQTPIVDTTGKTLLEAISLNKYVTMFDLRMTDISDEYHIAIQGIIAENSQQL
ncbi:hypothetical protein EDD86DRAFT_197652, partial [Gorgonomyces haynaldii]